MIVLNLFNHKNRMKSIILLIFLGYTFPCNNINFKETRPKAYSLLQDSNPIKLVLTPSSAKGGGYFFILFEKMS